MSPQDHAHPAQRRPSEVEEILDAHTLAQILTSMPGIGIRTAAAYKVSGIPFRPSTAVSPELVTRMLQTVLRSWTDLRTREEAPWPTEEQTLIGAQ